MAATADIRGMLLGGKPSSIGRADEVVALCRKEPAAYTPLLNCLWDEDVIVRRRAANAVEKLARTDAARLQRRETALMLLAEETCEPHVRWALALTVPRLRLNRAECHHFAGVLRGYLRDKSSIVRTFAMQGLADLTGQSPDLRPEALDTIRALTRSGTPAMRARGRHLQQKLEAKQ